MAVLRKISGKASDQSLEKRDDPELDSLIELSRRAVKRARQAMAVARQFDCDREARNTELRKLRADAERSIQRLENEMEVARKFLISSPAPDSHD